LSKIAEQAKRGKVFHSGADPRVLNLLSSVDRTEVMQHFDMEGNCLVHSPATPDEEKAHTLGEALKGSLLWDQNE